MNSSAGQGLECAFSELPPPLRGPARVWFERFLAHEPAGFESFMDEPRKRNGLVRLVACSDFAGQSLTRHWDWFAGAAVAGQLARQPETSFRLPREEREAPIAQQELRQFRNRKLLHILWRDLVEGASVEETMSSLSSLADSLVAAATRYAETLLQRRFGTPRDAEGHTLRLVVLAMGKLGGRELNFSSDIDLIFLFPGDGDTDGERPLSAREFFARLSRRIVSLLDEVTADGFCYRVDTRLRPFGESGPPVVSFGALESYLLRHGRSWERYAYVKARIIDTGLAPDIGDRLMREIVEPFVYRRYLDYGVFEALREMKQLVSTEARKRSLADNIKLGPGGIREIEFIVQSLQLVRGGSDRNLKTQRLTEALEYLGRSGGLKVAEAAELKAAYLFLRRLENAIQAIRDQQQHDLPAEELDRARLALALNSAGWTELAAELTRYRDLVNRHFAAVAFRGADAAVEPGGEDPIAAMWSAGGTNEEWATLLDRLGYAESAGLAESLVTLGDSSSVAQIGKTGGRRLARFVPALLATLKGRPNPAAILPRIIGVVEQILRRSAYVALLNENPVVLDRLVNLCATSGWLAEEIGRYPLLLDEMLDPRLYTAPLSREDMLADLERRLDGLAGSDSEQQIEILAQFQRASLFRIAVADVSGNLPVMKVSDRLTELAEVVVHRALDIAWRDLVALHGRPRMQVGPRHRVAGFGVIAYGKFGGMELSYRSDLDLVFLHDGRGSDQETDGPKPLDNSMFFARLVRRVVHFLTIQTGSGALYQVDTRLRPSGRSGLLVTSVEAFERYQEENAWTWEHQALLRSRSVAGSATVSREFERIRADTLRHRVKRERLLNDVRDMRAKMRDQLDKSSAGRFDLKQGPGGIAEIEFLVQYLVLKNAADHPAVIHYTDNIRQLGTLAAAGCLPGADVNRLQEIYKTYRLRLHRLVLDEQPPFVAPAEFVEEREFVVALRERTM